MAAPRDAAMLARPAALVVLQCAIAMIDDARDSAITLLHARDDDPDAVHDFRVAVRRLRSWLQLWSDELDAVVSRKQRRRIRDLAHATGPARDLQVHLEWLRGEEASAKGGGARWRTWSGRSPIWCHAGPRRWTTYAGRRRSSSSCT